jgi:hypothetical protein
MRFALILAAIGLVASLPLAPWHARGLDEGLFWDTDPARRAARGEEEGSLGVAMAGYEDLFNATGDLDALRHRIRTGLLIGAVAVRQPGLDALIEMQTRAYLERREELDPDGTFLQEVLERWVQERLHFDWETRLGLYARTATAMFLAARGDPEAAKLLLKLMGQGGFYSEFFPYVRARHPGWPAVEPLARHYLEQGNLAARVEAGATLLNYYILFGVGGDLWDRHREGIRSAFAEMRRRVLKFDQDPMTTGSGGTALNGIAMVGLLGFETERKIIALGRPERYAGHADVMRIARLWTGADSFDSVDQTSRVFRDLTPEARAQYYGAAAHRLAALHRGLIEGSEEERDLLTRLLEAAYDETGSATRALALQTFVSLGAKQAPALIRRAIVGRGAFSIDAAALADDLEDPVPILLPALRSQEPDYAALAAVSLLDRGEGRALQR